MPVRASALFAVALAGVVVGVSACGGDGSGSDAYGESGAISLTAESVTVEMKDLSFQPQGIKVKPGTK